MKKSALWLCLWAAAPAFAAEPPAEEVVDVPESATEGYTPAEEPSREALRFTGYLDVGFAKAFGDGTSFAPNDVRAPLDYGVDPFAPAVNSRGEVASTDSGGRFLNGFLPRSVGIGGRPSFLINTVSADVRYQPRSVPLLVFARLQLMPRLSGAGDGTRLELQQAFGRLSPFKNHELALFVGKFDSVFGAEYLENEANLRTGITPSLTARYTTGQSVGLKVFYRLELPTLWSAVSLNVAATNSGTRIEALVPPDASLVGIPVGSARLGYELNLQRLQVKAGLSGLVGPRNDNPSGATQQGIGADLRVTAYGLAFAGELVRLSDAPGLQAGKLTGQGPAELASGFEVFGGWGRLAWTAPLHGEVLTALTVYGRYDRRHAKFEGYTELHTDRFTVGARLDLFEFLALKAEFLFNRELSGAPTTDNDVFTSSAVFTW